MDLKRIDAGNENISFIPLCQSKKGITGNFFDKLIFALAPAFTVDFVNIFIKYFIGSRELLVVFRWLHTILNSNTIWGRIQFKQMTTIVFIMLAILLVHIFQWILIPVKVYQTVFKFVTFLQNCYLNMLWNNIFFKTLQFCMYVNMLFLFC